MKRFLLTLAALLVPVFAVAQGDQGQSRAANFAYKYDVASATATFCTLSGVDGDPFGLPYQGRGTIETVGSNTGVNAADDVFVDVGVGDVILVTIRNTSYVLVVVTNADDDTITVDTAVDFSAGVVWSYKSLACGTTVNDGWISTAGYQTAQLTAQYDAGDLTALAIAFQCKEDALGSSMVQVYPGPSSECGFGTLATDVCEFTAPGAALTFKIPHNAFAACRVSLAYVTADGATVDEVTATISLGR